MSGLAAGWPAALPLSLILLVIGWLLLCWVICRLPNGELPGVRDLMADHHRGLGPMSTPEWRVAIVAVMTALLWVGHPLVHDVLGTEIFTDTSIAIGAAVLLFVLPAGTGAGERLLDWPTAKRSPWNILLLFGGGLSLAHAMQITGLAQWVGIGMEGLISWPHLLVVGAMVFDRCVFDRKS